MNEKLERWWLHIILSQRCNLSSEDLLPFLCYIVSHSEKDTKWTQLVNIIKKKFDIPLYPGAQLDFVSHVGLWAICLWYFICHPNTKEVNIIFLLGTQKLRNYIWRFSCNLSLTEKWFHWNMTTSGSGDYPCYPKRFFKGDNESIPKYDPLLSARLDIAVPLRNAVLLFDSFSYGITCCKHVLRGLSSGEISGVDGNMIFLCLISHLPSSQKVLPKLL